MADLNKEYSRMILGVTDNINHSIFGGVCVEDIFLWHLEWLNTSIYIWNISVFGGVWVESTVLWYTEWRGTCITISTRSNSVFGIVCLEGIAVW